MCVLGRLKCGLIRWTGKYDNISFRIKAPFSLKMKDSFFFLIIYFDVLNNFSSMHFVHWKPLKVKNWLSYRSVKLLSVC